VNGSVDLGHLSASGTASSSTFLRGDNSWVAAGGDLSFGGDNFGADKTIGSNDTYALSFETDGNVAMKIDTAGIITKPLQPCFLATITGETRTDMDTAPTMKYSNELIDLNGDYDNATYTFTAPVTGSYHFNWSLGISGMSSEDNDWYVRLYTSNFSARSPNGLFQRRKSQVNVDQLSASAVVDMDASDTAYIICNSYDDGTLETYIERSWFSGYLVA